MPANELSRRSVPGYHRRTAGWVCHGEPAVTTLLPHPLPLDVEARDAVFWDEDRLALTTPSAEVTGTSGRTSKPEFKTGWARLENP